MLKIEWQIDPKLYTFSARVLVDWLRDFSDEFNQVTLVGHNPAMTDLINQLSDAGLGNLPTCAYAQLQSNSHSWSEIEAVEFNLCPLLKPKMFK